MYIIFYSIKCSLIQLYSNSIYKIVLNSNFGSNLLIYYLNNIILYSLIFDFEWSEESIDIIYNDSFFICIHFFA